MTEEEYKEFERKFEAEQDEKRQKRLEELEAEFPLQERILRATQMHAQEQAAKRAAELEKYDDGLDIDVSQFKSITIADVINILGSTIKKDDTNKAITFLALLSAFTEDAQFNISFNAPSSSGKSYIPLEIATLFPTKDVVKLGSCSPTAFFHEQGEYDKENNIIKVDLSRKIIIFMDQPNSELLKRLRSLLSHDDKEIQSKITDKNQKGGNRTKTVIIKGFPTVIFCTASLNFDEQESTRFFLLSPEIDSEKIIQAVKEKIKKSSNRLDYANALETSPERSMLKDRILAIRAEHITDINFKSPEEIEKRFFQRAQKPKLRHQRDIARIMNLVKVSALLNLWFRERHGSTIIANDEDVDAAFKLWDSIADSQELSLPPYVYNLYKDIIIPAYKDRNGELDGGVIKIGLTRQDIMQKYYLVYNRYMPDWQLRQWIIPMLETSGLVLQEPDPLDKRRMLIYPTSINTNPPENNSESGSGVDEDEDSKGWVEMVKESFGFTGELEDVEQPSLLEGANG
jgi:hypothetical protein